MEYDCENVIATSSSTSSSLSSLDYAHYLKQTSQMVTSPTASVAAAVAAAMPTHSRSNQPLGSLLLAQHNHHNNVDTNGFPHNVNSSSLGSASSSSSSSSSSSTSSLSSSITPNMPNSTSLIFYTAASFNINQSDTIAFQRESIHLLARFLAMSSEQSIFRCLYTYAPDNLAWLWAFCDWESPIDLSQVPVQDTYKPFQWSLEDTGSQSLSATNEMDLNKINKLFADSPLIQYKYRENLMIGDLFKIIEHVNKVNSTSVLVAKALFVLYFPRFSMFMDNPLKKICNPKILSANLHIVKELDFMLTNMIRTRYNVNEYKETILTSNNLPSYVRSLLNESGFLSSSSNRLLIQTLASGLKTTTLTSPPMSSPSYQQQPTPSTPHHYTYQHQLDNYDKFASVHKPAPLISSHLAVDQSSMDDTKYLLQTMSYFKNLEKNKINNDLDHVSFDCHHNNVVTRNLIGFEQHQQQQQLQLQQQSLDEQEEEIASILLKNEANKKFQPRLSLPDVPTPKTRDSFENPTPSYFLTVPNNVNELNVASYRNAVNNLRLSTMSSPISTGTCPTSNSSAAQLAQIIQTNAAKLLMNTPQTPTTCFSPYFNEGPKSSDLWCAGGGSVSRLGTGRVTNNCYTSSVTTPPPSAKSTQQQLSLLTSNEMLFDDSAYNNFILATGVGGTGTALVSSHSSSDSSTVTPPNENLNQFDTFLMGEEQFAKYFNNQQQQSLYLSPPLTRPLSSNAPATAVKSSNSPTKRDFNEEQYLNTATANDLLNCIGGLSNLNINTTTNNKLSAAAATGVHSPMTPIGMKSSPMPHYTNSSSSSASNSSNKASNNNSAAAAVYAHLNGQNSTQHVWCGRLPPKVYPDNSIYSRKVFLGGLPWDVNQLLLTQMLQKYGSVKIEIPGKDLRHPRVSNICKSQERSTPGYVYVIFDHESAVQRLLKDCRRDVKHQGEHYYYNIYIPPTNLMIGGQNGVSNNNNNNGMTAYYGQPSGGGGTGHHNGYYLNKRTGGKSKEVEVIPWNQEDTSFVPQMKNSVLPAKIDARSTIFVGALHGMLNAHGLGKVMSEVFGEVIHAGLDTDKYKYPIGSGRVTFRDRQSYIKAINAKYVTIKANMDASDPSPKFEKTIQIDPYLEEAKCCKCEHKSQYFCRNELCLDYYCHTCWHTAYKHDTRLNGEHVALSRQNKPNHG